MKEEIAPTGALAAIDAPFLDAGDLEDAFFAAESAARILAKGGDLANALSAWDLITVAGHRLGFDRDRLGRNRLANRLAQRARVLDRMDRIDDARAGFLEAERSYRGSGDHRVADHVSASAARLERKIARRDAGKSYPRHKERAFPEFIEAEREAWRERRRAKENPASEAGEERG